MIGTDFELFMKSGDTHIPVPGNLDIGSKGGTHVNLSYGSMHRDNVMVEICPLPVASGNAMVERVGMLVSEAEHYLSGRMGELITLSFDPVVEFSEDVLASKFAQEIGCDRDWLASHGRGSQRAAMGAHDLVVYRCGGGHVHISYGTYAGLGVPHAIAIHFADLALGTLEAMMGTQGIRRRYYGLPGLYRPTKYSQTEGVEYRTPSNLWLSKPEYIKAMVANASNIEALIRYGNRDTLVQFLRDHWPALNAQGSIANENREECQQALVACQDAFPNYTWHTGV